MLTRTKLGYLRQVHAAAEAVCPGEGVPFQVCVAQAMLETGWVVGALTKRGALHPEEIGWNLFGIKGSGSGGTQVWSTKEFRGTPGQGGRYETVEQRFARYRDLEDAVRAWCAFVRKDRYQLARQHFADDPAWFLFVVWGMGYATSPTYVPRVLSVMRRIGRELGDARYDVAPGGQLAGHIDQAQRLEAGKARRAFVHVAVEARLTPPVVPVELAPPPPQDPDRHEFNPTAANAWLRFIRRIAGKE